MILYYNTQVISEKFKVNPREYQFYLNKKHFSRDLFNKYEKFGLNRHNMIYDRSGSLPHYLEISPLHPLPKKDDSFNFSFFEIAERRAKELIALNKPINVMWSGGIDSTFVLFMLQHYATDPDQIRVYGTYNSVIESGDLFDRRIKKEFKHFIKVATTRELNYLEVDGIFVSGMGGNQLFGPTDNFFATGGHAMFHHTLGTPKTIYEDYTKCIDPELLEFLDPAIKASPRKLETVADLRWYCIFNLDWYTGLYEHRTHAEPHIAKTVLGFFDSEEFQQWAITTTEPFTKIKGNPNTHRWQMRQVLDELFGEPHYAINKDKKISNFAICDPQWVMLTDEFENLYIRNL